MQCYIKPIRNTKPGWFEPIWPALIYCNTALTTDIQNWRDSKNNQCRERKEWQRNCFFGLANRLGSSSQLPRSSQCPALLGTCTP